MKAEEEENKRRRWRNPHARDWYYTRSEFNEIITQPAVDPSPHAVEAPVRWAGVTTTAQQQLLGLKKDIYIYKKNEESEIRRRGRELADILLYAYRAIGACARLLSLSLFAVCIVKPVQAMQMSCYLILLLKRISSFYYYLLTIHSYSLAQQRLFIASPLKVIPFILDFCFYSDWIITIEFFSLFVPLVSVFFGKEIFFDEEAFT